MSQTTVDRATFIYEARAAGRTFTSIAAELGISPSYVQRLWRHEHVARHREEFEAEMRRLVETRDAWRRAARLDAQEAGCSPPEAGL